MSDTGSHIDAPRAASDAGTSRPSSSSHVGEAARASSSPVLDDATIISSQPPMAPPSGSGSPGSPRLDLSGLRLGESLDHFELRQYVGGGGMGAVFLAHDQMLDREVAIKVLPREQASDEETLLRFRNEGRSAARLDHENIVRAFHVGEDRGLHYIVFEFVGGVNLRDLVEQRGPLPLGSALAYTLQIAEALAHLSSHQVVHRDIKPSNVLVTREGRVKLVDMGLARLQLNNPSDDDLTASGVTLGTFDYISPEQARDPRNADVRSDIYSLGCSLFYMLTARPPFPEGTVLQKLLQHQGDDPPDPRELAPELPEEISTIVRRMMAKDPTRRYQNPGQLIADLLLVSERLGLRAPGMGGVVWVASTGEDLSWLGRNAPWIAPVAALVAIVFLLDMFWSSTASVDTLAARPTASPAPAEETPAPRTEAAAGNETREPGSPPTVVAGATDDVEQAPTTPQPRVDDAISSGASEASSAEGNDGRRVAVDPLGRIPFPGVSPADALSRDASPSVGGDESPRANVGGSGSAQPRVAAAPPREGRLVVDPMGEGPRTFRSLQAACSHAGNGDMIELHFDGVLEEKSIALNNLNLTIRAGDGYHPTILLRPPRKDPLGAARGMVTVTGGSLTLVDVNVEFETPQEVLADRWSMLELQGVQSVTLEHCILTVRNAVGGTATYHPDTAFFRITAPPGMGSMMRPGEAVSPKPGELKLRNCVVRGEAVLLRVEDQQPISLSWDNGFLAAGEQLLAVQGGPMRVENATTIEVELRHLTAILRGGLARFTGLPGAVYLPTTEWDVSNSIVQVEPGAPLIEHVGVESASAAQAQMTWEGRRNFYDVERFWRIATVYAVGDPTPRGEAEWRTYWQDREFMPTVGPMRWRRAPESNRPWRLRAPGDYTLDRSDPMNAAVGGAEDGRDVGFDLSLLPELETPAADMGDARSTLPLEAGAEGGDPAVPSGVN